MTQPTTRHDISEAQAVLIVNEAAKWKGTPYALRGASSIKASGGDCSGTTFLIFGMAGFPYGYVQAAGFPAYAQRTGQFRKLQAGEPKQDGDILSWSNHMAIYAAAALMKSEDGTTARVNRSGRPWTQKNDIWSASHPNGPAYAPAALQYWRPDPPAVYRYQVEP